MANLWCRVLESCVGQGGGNHIWLIFWKIDGEESWTREVRWLKTQFTKCYGKLWAGVDGLGTYLSSFLENRWSSVLDLGRARMSCAQVPNEADFAEGGWGFP
jgi:hypothetical protein